MAILEVGLAGYINARLLSTIFMLLFSHHYVNFTWSMMLKLLNKVVQSENETTFFGLT